MVDPKHRRDVDDDPEDTSDALKYDNNFWAGKLGPEAAKLGKYDKYHLIFSLIIFLVVPLAQFFHWFFTNNIHIVHSRIGTFIEDKGSDFLRGCAGKFLVSFIAGDTNATAELSSASVSLKIARMRDQYVLYNVSKLQHTCSTRVRDRAWSLGCLIALVEGRNVA